MHTVKPSFRRSLLASACLRLALPLGLLLVLPVSTAEAKSKAKEMSAEEIVRKTNKTAYYQGKDMRARVTMTIYGKSGNKRVREFTMLRRDAGDDNGDQSFYLYFHKPADVAKTVFIAQKHIGSEDDRWLYLPGLDLVKRIAAADDRTSFVGSDWYYEDVSGRDINADAHKLVQTTKSYYVLEHTPKKPSSVEFRSYKMWVHRGSFLPTKVEYFDSKGKKYRVMTVDAVEKIGDYTTVTKATMKSLRAGTKTTVEYRKIGYDLGLPSKLFGERYLRRAPRKYLK